MECPPALGWPQGPRLQPGLLRPQLDRPSQVLMAGPLPSGRGVVRVSLATPGCTEPGARVRGRWSESGASPLQLRPLQGLNFLEGN